ncbi:MAG TPA: radical SAM family heme chaperone HemW [Clostridiales bacterium]|nr:radical SAM family heme chaperone HemW [Clostridiales bacterium]
MNNKKSSNLIDELGIYVHIPFCLKKCYYCDFFSQPISNEKVQFYVKKLKNEINNVKNLLIDRKINTLYFGGGTPNTITKQDFYEIYDCIYNNFNLALNEFTVEINPGAGLNPEFLKNLGVNRASVGVQSLNDKSLTSIGRIHSKDMAIKCLDEHSKYFDNLSCDLMLGIPYQTKDDIKYFIDTVSKYVKHISVYMLEVPKQSKLKFMIDRGLKVADEDKLADFYNFTYNLLKEYNFSRYEVSNFSLSGYESKHNLIYWKYMDYLGLGSSACSKIGNIRYSNSKSLDYQKEKEELSIKEMENEFIMLSLRLEEGLDLTQYQNLFNINFFDKYSNKIKKLIKYLDISDTYIRIKSQYLIFENSILVELLDF